MDRTPAGPWAAPSTNVTSRQPGLPPRRPFRRLPNVLCAGLFALLAGVLSMPAPTSACLHAGPGFAVTQRSFEAFAVVHDGREDLVLKIAYASEQPLPAMGMVIPVPNAPDRYAALEPGFFEALRGWVDVDTGTHVRGRGLGRRATTPVVELDPVRVGPYDIQPIQARGPQGVGAVRAWLEEHGFSSIPTQALAPFAEAGWTYVTVRVSPEGEALAQTAGLPPLHLSFASPAAVFPVRLEAQGVFPMWLYLATPGPLPSDAFEGAVAKGFQVAMAGSQPEIPRTDYFPMSRLHAFEAATTPAPVRAFLESIGDWDEQSLYLRVLHARRFGEGRADPSTWSDALSIPALPDAALVVDGGAPDTEASDGTEPELEPDLEPGLEEDPAAREAPAAQLEPATAQVVEDEEAEEPAAPGSAPSGCGCRAAPRERSLPALAIGALVLMLARRRRSAL